MNTSIGCTRPSCWCLKNSISRGTIRPGMPGVFSGDARIATVGVAVSRWIAYHGLTFNVGPYLELFDVLDEPAGNGQTPFATPRWKPAASGIPPCPRSARPWCAGSKKSSASSGTTFTPSTRWSAARSSRMSMPPHPGDHGPVMLPSLTVLATSAAQRAPCHAARARAHPPAARMAQTADPGGGRDGVHPQPGRRARPRNRLRKRQMPQSLGMLDQTHRHVHDPGQRLHPAVRLLRGRPRASRGCRNRRARATGRGLPSPGTAPRRHYFGHSRRPTRRRCRPFPPVRFGRARRTGATIEVLTPDFDGRREAIDVVLRSPARKSSTTTWKPSPDFNSTCAARASTP